MGGGQSLDKEAVSGPGSRRAERGATCLKERSKVTGPPAARPQLSSDGLRALKSPSAKPGPSPQSSRLETPTVSNKNVERMDL